MNFREQLVAAMQGNVAVIGIGNPWRGDDAAGSCVAREIYAAPGVYAIDAQEVPESYVCHIAQRRPDTVVLIDSVDMHSAPGSVALLDKSQMSAYWPSTHRVPISLLADYLERETQARIFLLAIQPAQTAFLQPLSDDVSRSVLAIGRILNDVLKSARHRRDLECGSGAAATRLGPRQGARIRKESAACPAALQGSSRG